MKHGLRLLFLGCFLFLGQPLCQASLQKAEALVTVQNQNTLQAKADAILQAKRNIVSQYLALILHPTLLEQAHSFFEKTLFVQIDRYLDQQSLLQQKWLPETGQFQVELQAYLQQDKVIQTLRKHHIPLNTDPQKTLALIYDANRPFWQMWDPQQILQNALNPWLQGYRVQLSHTWAVSPQEARQIRNTPQQILKGNDVWDSGVDGALWLDVRQEGNESFFQLAMNLYDSHGKEVSALQTSHLLPTPPTVYDVSTLKEILHPLKEQWQPLFQSFYQHLAQTLTLTLRLQGSLSPEHQQHFVQKLLQNDPLWESLRLQTLSKHFVEYQGTYLGNHENLVQNLRNKSFDDFQIQKISWNEESLALFVTQSTIASPLEAFTSNKHIPQDSEPLPTLQTNSQQKVPLYALPPNTWVYDHLRNRQDDRTFQVYWAKPEESLVIHWKRLARTHLSPMLGIYGRNRQLLKSFVLKGREGKIEYDVPKEDFVFLIRIKDEIGYVESQANSYPSFHYVLQVER